jgi:glutathione S-transferase
MKLYGSLVSPYVARVVLQARAKGVSLEPNAPPGGGLKSPEYLAMNPLGKMPTLEVDGRHIAESSVIMEYLEEAHPQKPLLAKDPFERARARLLARILDLYVMSQTGALFRNMNPAQRDQAQVDAAVQAIRKGLADLEHFFGSGPYAGGASIGLADCALLPCTLLLRGALPAFGVSDMFAGLPKLARWWQQMQSDAFCAAFCTEYDAALKAFMASRRG